MRILNFGIDDTVKYDLIYEAFAMTDRPFKGGDVRLAAKVFDKLEILGKYQKDKLGRSLYVFDKPGEIQFEEIEFKLLIDAMNNVTWNALGARKVASVMEWLEGIKEESSGPKLDK